MADRIQENQFTYGEGQTMNSDDVEIANRPGQPVNGRDYGTAGQQDEDADRPSDNAEEAVTRKPAANTDAVATRALAPDLLRGLLMVFMALDHNVLALNAWEHGQGRVGEGDGAVVHEWNRPIAYTIRTLTHLCAPGFTFLLGMGVVYFGRSRARLGWTGFQMVWHFVIRAVVLTLLCVLMGVVVSGGSIWFLNVVLFSLAIDYLLAGLLWLVISKTEPVLARGFAACLPEDTEDDDATQPLLTMSNGVKISAKEKWAADLSWHLHNVVLLALTGVTIWWNIWLSPTHGRCSAGTKPVTAKIIPDSPILRIWFWVVQEIGAISAFPPLAWISFSILGLLYGRLILARPWSVKTIRLATLLSALAFGLFFVFTRVFDFGNLSTGCLQTAEHTAHPGTNQYLVSPKSFFYITKYPPDVAFFSFTMAANLLLLTLFDVIPPRIASRFSILLAYGTSALFFYIVHQFMLFSLGGLLTRLYGHDMGFEDPVMQKPAIGIDNLWVYFGLWAITLAILSPLCHLYSRFKKTKGPNSIWRFF
ncbi:Uu.00g076780.m01.CDS01 [Anthostomella pinea]|uniref:Uu.00g076780.m01.CDS01 n=1 Tax=Anthostomella pinea TaxID=933095 RepID=A0AAI8VVZ0_9PEZI|nr:Uu.00g076780.m01.CDS01 [Anthostomella pinea]